jgi:tetratricopeptide (TPR) repeat protein
LGFVAGTRQDLDAAEQWFFKSLDICEKLNDEIGMADCYTHLGSLACDQCDYEASKKWYEKALEIYKKRGVMNWAAKNCTSLGNICLSNTAGKQCDYDSAQKWFRKALEFDDDATWWDWLTFYARLWRRKFLGVFSK